MRGGLLRLPHGAIFLCRDPAKAARRGGHGQAPRRAGCHGGRSRAGQPRVHVHRHREVDRSGRCDRRRSLGEPPRVARPGPTLPLRLPRRRGSPPHRRRGSSWPSMTLDPPSPAPCRSSGCWRNIAGHKDSPRSCASGCTRRRPSVEGRTTAARRSTRRPGSRRSPRGGEILATSDTVADAGEVIVGSDAREVTLRGVAEPVEIARVEWR
jgi:hypothetical protein